MQVGDVALLDGAAQAALVVAESYAVLFDDIAGTAHRCGAVVAVLGHLVSGPRHDKTGACRYVEGVLAVAACPYDVDGRKVAQVDAYAGFEQGLTESDKLVDRDRPHFVDREQGGYLSFVVLSPRDAEEQLFRFFAGENLVIEKSEEYSFHGCIMR